MSDDKIVDDALAILLTEQDGSIRTPVEKGPPKRTPKRIKPPPVPPKRKSVRNTRPVIINLPPIQFVHIEQPFLYGYDIPVVKVPIKLKDIDPRRVYLNTDTGVVKILNHGELHPEVDVPDEGLGLDTYDNYEDI